MNNGLKIYNLAKELFPIYRHLTGKGVNITLNKIKKIIPDLKIHKIRSGTKCFYWNS